MRKSIAVFALMLCAVCLSGVGFAEAKHTREYHETFSVDSDVEVSVGNVNGTIDVETWNRDEVEVYAKIESKDRDALDDVEIVVDVGQTTTIDTRYHRSRDNDDGYFERMKKRLTGKNRANVNYKIKIPEGARLKKASTTNGNVNVRDISGDTDLSTTNGTIKTKTDNAIINATTTNGNIELSGASVVRKATTTNGSISANIVDDLKGDVNLSTTNGSITLYVSKNIDAELDCSTTNGKVRADGFTLTINEVKKNRLKGRIGDGGHTVRARTTNGSINIRDN